LRQRGFSNEVTCIYSEENIPPQKNDLGCGSGTCVCPQITTTNEGIEIPAHEWCSSKQQINGSAVHITAIYGFIMAGLIIQEIAGKDNNDDIDKDCNMKDIDIAESSDLMINGKVHL
jgi:tRNA A37 threonylcarbamoyladenosine dehydratase